MDITNIAAPPMPAFLLLLGPHAASQAMLDLAAHLALRRGPVRVLDGGNRFNAYHVARALRRLGQADPALALARIQVARAFTCYQMAALIERTPPANLPVLVIDLLGNFYDESAPLDERRRLLQRLLPRLGALSIHAPLVASLRPPPPGCPDPTGLQDLVQSAADLVLFQDSGDAPQGMLPCRPVRAQLSLF